MAPGSRDRLPPGVRGAGGGREGEGEGAAAARLAFDGHAASMGDGDELHDAQAETAAAAFAREALIDLVEGLKDPSSFPRWDADSIVFHRKIHAAVVSPNAENDVLNLIRILAGVFEQVVQGRRQRQIGRAS